MSIKIVGTHLPQYIHIILEIFALTYYINDFYRQLLVSNKNLKMEMA